MSRIDDACAAAADELKGSGIRFALVAWLPGREMETPAVAVGSSNEAGDAPVAYHEVARACQTAMIAMTMQAADAEIEERSDD